MKPQNSDPHAVREKVRAGYSQIALHGSERRKPSCCCGMSAVDSDKLARQIGYSAGELSALPDGEEKLAVYRRVRDEIRRFVENLPAALAAKM